MKNGKTESEVLRTPFGATFGAPGGAKNVNKSNPLIKLGSIFLDFSRFWSSFGVPGCPAGVPKSHFSSKIPEKIKKNEVHEPFLKKHEIWMKSRCENERAGRVKTSVSLHTSFKI